MLSNLNLKATYDPSVDSSDVLTDFYIPCLKNSIKYDRLSAYFSSNILKKFGEGLNEFVKNNGKARFIFSCEINPEEMKNIVVAYKQKMDYLSDNLSDENLKNDFNVANLSYLISTGVVEVKIAFMLNTRSALMHIKSGFFEDQEGNKVYFDGSGNETESGILFNAELFHVFTNFSGTDSLVNDGEKRFEKLWNNTYSPNIRTEYPVGKLFEKLTSYNQHRIFNSADEFYEYKNCVLVDIDEKMSAIMIQDYTKNKALKMPMVLKSKLGTRWHEIRKDSYCVDRLDLQTLKGIIISSLDKFKIPYVLSNRTLFYIDKCDLQIEKRVKLAKSIKNKLNESMWMLDYYQFKEIVDYETCVHLKDKQMENAFFHYQMKSSCNFSVPGTGKTYISYGLFAYLHSSYKKERDIDSIVVFGPINCFKAWKDEGKAIFNNRLTMFDVTEHRGDFEQTLKNGKYNVYLFNYEFINDKKVDVLSHYVLSGRTMVVFDEIHKLKSLDGTRANLFIKLFSNCNEKPIYKLALTGTPIPNAMTDIYNYLVLLYNDDLNGYFSDLSINRLKLSKSDPSIELAVRDKLNPVFVRTTKNDMLVPPPEDDNLLIVNPNEDEIELFNLIWKTYKNPLVKFIRLIQASSNPKLVTKNLDVNDINLIAEDGEEFSDDQINEYINSDQLEELTNRIGMSSKTQKTLDTICSIAESGEKVLVWCLFVDTIDLIVNELNRRGINTISISGVDEVKARESKIESFKNQDIQVLVTNPNTLAESVSLHKNCHNAVYLEFGFNLTYLLQSKDRIHRVGLTNNDKTNYYFSISDTSANGAIDRYIYDVLSEKADRMKRIIESNDISVMFESSDLQDIEEILNKARVR